MTKQKSHPLIFVAFLLAVFLLINPVEADCVTSSLRAGHLVEALLSFAAAIAAVAIPLLYAQRQTRRRPEKYKPRLLSQMTWAIIGLNAVFNTLMFADYLSRRSASIRAIARVPSLELAWLWRFAIAALEVR